MVVFPENVMFTVRKALSQGETCKYSLSYFLCWAVAESAEEQYPWSVVSFSRSLKCRLLIMQGLEILPRLQVC